MRLLNIDRHSNGIVIEWFDGVRQPKVYTTQMLTEALTDIYKACTPENTRFDVVKIERTWAEADGK